MRPNRRVFVVGGSHSTYLGPGHPDFVHGRSAEPTEKRNPTLEEHMRSVTQAIFGNGRFDPSLVDKGYVSNFLGECFSKQGHLGSMLVAVESRLAGKSFARIEAACASGSAAVAACVESIQAGADVTYVLGCEVETNARAKDGIDYMARAAHYEKDRSKSFFTFPWFFARRAKAYKERYGATNEDIGRVVVKAYNNASLNPQAQMRTVDMNLEKAVTASEDNYEFLDDERLREHIKLYDCTTFTDGATGLLLASEEGLAKLGVSMHESTEILAFGHTVRGLGEESNASVLENMFDAAAIAYRDAEVGPEDMGVGEVHDCFAINELLQYEALRFCELGEGAALLRDGATQLDGKIPVNTGGGLLGFGHPIGATGVKQVLEIHKQLKGECGDYQVANAPSHGINANLGGDDRTGIVMIQRNCE